MRGLFEKLNTLLIKHSDLLLAGLVVLIMATIVIRIPPEMMDWLIAINIAIAATVLLTALYVSDAVKLPSFPTILLLTTLFRLGLNISTTRLILLEADAGDIIDSFGEFVVGGNFVVGGVVFLVIVLVQFIVIAKGSERVAEVSARFTLDAMPGKQMSIDADLRGGMITPEEARNRRQSLERESKLYGAMDGAMKFVKGDAIAGIIISLINIIGGLIVGVMQQGMEVGEAAQVYSLLTIGDGLVSQIPALLISVSAGLVVTRVAAESGADGKGGGRVAGDIVNQVLRQPKALAVVSAVLLGMAFLPGFPSLVFFVLCGLAAVLAVVGWTRLDDAEVAAQAQAAAVQEAATDVATQSGPVPLALEIDSELGVMFFQEREVVGPDGQVTIQQTATDGLPEMLRAARFELERELGISIPPIVLQPDDRPAEAGGPGYRVVIHGAPVASGKAEAQHVVLVGDKPWEPEVTASLGIEHEYALPWCRAVVPSVPFDAFDGVLDKIGKLDPPPMFKVLDVRDLALSHLKAVVRRYAAEFLGIQRVNDLVEQLKESQPDLVKAVVPVVLNVAQLTELLQHLMRDGVPMRDLPKLLEAATRHAPKAGNPIDVEVLAGLVRRDMGRAICAHLSKGRASLGFYALDPQLENAAAESMRETQSGVTLALNLDERRRLLQSLNAGIPAHRHVEDPAVLAVSQPVLRGPLSELIKPYLPEVVVVTYDDLSAEIVPKQLGLIMPADEPVEA
ncbi:MAG: flagellar biosynthesis protein FlhA [Planctomycetota bacterium]